MTIHPYFQGQSRAKVVVLFILLPYAVFILSSIGGVNGLLPSIALLGIIGLLVARPLRLTVVGKTVLWSIIVLCLLGSTGWFFSPFFFALHLLGIALGFLFTPVVTSGFILALFSLFFFSVGEVNATYDFLMLLSLLSVIPIAIGLRKSYLLVEQERKDILILESGEQREGITTLDAILGNRVSRLSIQLRQPITYIRQGLVLLRQGKLIGRERTEVKDRMEQSAKELSTLVDEFESGTTRNTLLRRRDTKAKSSS